MDQGRRFTTVRLAAVTLLTLTVAGCGAASTPASIPTPQGAATIEEVWEKIGCMEDDPMGTGAYIQPDGLTTGVQRAGMCTPYEGGELVFFYEQDSPESLDAYLQSGRPELGPTDALFRDGAVAIMATDAATAQKFGGIFEPVEQ